MGAKIQRCLIYRQFHYEIFLCRFVHSLFRSLARSISFPPVYKSSATNVFRENPARGEGNSLSIDAWRPILAPNPAPDPESSVHMPPAALGPRLPSYHHLAG